VTLAEAIDLAMNFDSAVVGVVIDVYHVWWDPRRYAEIDRAKGRILGFHVSEWPVPLPDALMGRAMMGTE
jgi:sugar phosphate isomerase/epimerase